MRTSILLAVFVVRVVCGQGLPVIIQSPTNVSVTPGSAAAFSVIASGATSYQWRFNGVDLAEGTNATLLVTNAQSANRGYYLAIAKNASGWVPSAMAYLFLNYALSGGTLPLSNTNNTYFAGDIEAAFGETPTNGTVQIFAGPELDELQPVGSIIPYRFSPVTSRFYGGYFNAPDQSAPLLAPGQSCYYSVVAWYTNGGWPYCQPSTIMKLKAGTNGLRAPSCYGLKFPTWFAGEGVEPAIATAPTSQVRVPGETFTLSDSYVAYTDFGIPTCQWRKDGVPIVGATNSPVVYFSVQIGQWQPFLSLTNAQPADAGVYDLVVYGNEWVVSPKIFVSIQTTNGPGVLGQPALSGTQFVCNLVGAAGRNYRLQWSTNLTAWNDLMTLTNTTGTVRFTNGLSAPGAWFYRTVLVSF